MVHESQHRIEIPPQVRTTKNRRLKTSYFPPLRNKSARQSGAKKEKRIARFRRLSARWCGNKEMRCIRGMVFFSFLLPGLDSGGGDEVTESGYDDRDDDRYLMDTSRSALLIAALTLFHSLAPLALRSLQRPQHPLLNPSQRRLPRRQRRHQIQNIPHDSRMYHRSI